MRATGGIFVWSIESALLALFGIGTVLITQTFGGILTLTADMWAMLVVMGSCITNLILHTGIVMSSKQTRIQPIPGADDNGSLPDYAVSHLHKAVAQGHCCTVTLVLFLYVIIMLRSLTDLNWANAFYPAAPGLVWLAGSVTLSFITVIWITSIAGAWVATAMGDYNSLFCTLPTTSIACIMYPVIHEIGTNSGSRRVRPCKNTPEIHAHRRWRYAFFQDIQSITWSLYILGTRPLLTRRTWNQLGSDRHAVIPERNYDPRKQPGSRSLPLNISRERH
jgi:hypothetical protein